MLSHLLLISLERGLLFSKEKGRRNGSGKGEKGAWGKGKGEPEERMRGDCRRVVLYERRINSKKQSILGKVETQK